MLRFAPSPTGDMHIGSLRIALFNYILSKQRNEDFIVRIEDTDKEKNIEGKDTEILDLLALFSIEYSQIIYQSENVRFHTAMALQLMHEKRAFSCFCSPQWLENKHNEALSAKKEYRYDDACRDLPHELVLDNTNPFTIRINRPDKLIIIKDRIKGALSFAPDAIDSFVIMTQEKTPTYNFSSAVDDMLSDISLIIRDEEQIDNTPKQDHIRTSLNYEKKIEYVHLPTILNSDGEKIDARDKTVSVKWLLEEGFLPEAISNYLISTGSETPHKIFKLKDVFEWFNIDNISNSPTHFDLDILKQINREHLKNLDTKELSRYVGFADSEIGELARVYLKDIATTKELRNKIEPIFAPKVIPEVFAKPAKIIADTIKGAPYFEEYDEFKNYIMKESTISDKEFSSSIRILLTGAESGPEIAEIYKYIKNYIGEIIK